MDLAHEPPFRVGGMSVRPSTREVEHAGGREVLEPRVMEVLVTLARAEGAVVSRDDLIAACWDGRIVSDDAINRVISRIRRLAEAAGDSGFQLETITKVGYRLIAAPAGPVDQTSRPAQAGASRPRHWRAPALAAAGLAAAVVLLLAMLRVLPAAPPPAAPSQALTLAVMPFDDIGGGDETGYIADGLARDLRNMLSRVRGLRVISDSSSFAIAQEPIGAVEIGERLGADLLLDGSVRDSEGALRVTLELVDAATGAQTWTDVRTVFPDDLTRGQNTLFVAVLEELVRRLGPDRIEAFAPEQQRRNPTVYRLVLQARELADQATNLRQQGRLDEFAARSEAAERMARDAVALAPSDGDALVLLARIIGGWAAEPPSEGSPSADGRREEAMALFGRALAAEPDNPAALTTLAERYRTIEWRWAESETLVQRALAIDPNLADAHTTYAYLLGHEGRCLEGLEHARAAAQLDPEFLWRKLAEPRLLKCAGRRDEADALYQRYLDQDREQAFLASEIYTNFLAEGDAESMRAIASHIRDDLWKDEEIPAPMAAVLSRMDAGAHALEGRPAALLAILAADEEQILGDADVDKRPTEVGRSAVSTLWTLAVERAAAGDPARAVELLELAIVNGALYIPETMPYGAYEFTPQVRADPRYQALWRSDPRLVELAELRQRSAEARQMEGVRADGRRVRPR